METNNPGKPDATHAGAPTSNCNNKTWDSQRRERGIQQWLWEINNKEHRAAWPLPPLAANQSPAPISEHVPQAKLASYIEQERRGGMGFGWATRWWWESASPPLKAFLPLPARRLFQTPPHLFSAIRSVLCSPLGKETRIISFADRVLSPNTEGATWPPPSNLVGHVKYRSC